MKTNKEKFNHYKDLIRERERIFLDQYREEFPEIIYQVHPSGSIGTGIVDNIYYSHKIDHRHIWMENDNPKKSDVELIKQYYEMNIPMHKELIYFHYSEKHETFTSSSAHHFFDNIGPKKLFRIKEEAEKMAEIILKDNAEDKIFRDTHKKDASYNYLQNGYKFLGWMNSWKSIYFDREGNETTDPLKKYSFGYSTKDYPEYGSCRDLKHRKIEVSHNQRGSENTVSCPLCMIFYKYDSSD